MKKYHSAFIISVVFVLILFLPFDSSAEDTYVNGFVISEDNVLKEYTGSEAHIVIPDGVTSIKEYAFNGNKDIISVSIPKSVTSIGNSAFAYCSKLERVSVGGNPVKMGIGVFYNTPWLESQKDEYVVLAGTLIDYNGNSTSLKVPAGTKYVAGGIFPYEGDSFLSYGRKITSVTLPNGLLGILDGAFNECIKLNSITIPDSVTYIGVSSFRDCKALSYVKLPKSLEVIDEMAFNNCISLESIDIPYGTKTIESSFFNCTALKSVVIPDSVTRLNSTFSGCTALEEIKLSNNITRLSSITINETKWVKDSTDEFLVSGGILVKYNGKGGTVVIPKGIRVIGDAVFLDNDLIERVYIPDGVEHIGLGNFANCDNLKLVFIPSSVISIDGVRADTTRYWYMATGDPLTFLKSPKLTIYGPANSAAKNYHGFLFRGELDVGKYVVSDGSDLNIPDAPELHEEDFKENITYSVIKSPQNVIVDGKQMNFEVYNIDGSNYFKLRDIAYVLKGSPSQFSVDYDSKVNKISITLGATYTIVGGEMDTGADKSDTVKETGVSIVIDSESVELSAYNIGGNNFFKLRNLGIAIGFDVDYDEVENLVLINSSESGSIKK